MQDVSRQLGACLDNMISFINFQRQTALLNTQPESCVLSGVLLAHLLLTVFNQIYLTVDLPVVLSTSLIIGGGFGFPRFVIV